MKLLRSNWNLLAMVALAGCHAPTSLRTPGSNDRSFESAKSGENRMRPTNSELYYEDHGHPGGRAVSLRVLQERLKAGPPASDPEHVLTLCGLRRIDAVVKDDRTGDLLLVGSTIGPSPLWTSDFAVALRCSFNLYGERKGDTIYISPAAISIDPNPAVIAKLHRLLAENALDAPGLLAAYQKLGASPQAVRIIGLPSCHAAAVAVDCDYHLKRITNGTVPCPIAGLKSLFDLRAQPDRDHPFDKHGGPSSSMDRFWFAVGKTEFVEDDGVAVLNEAPVRLLTEAQYQHGGRIEGTGRADGMADAWVTEFTQRYDEVASKEPRYAELASIYRLFAIANVVHARDDEFSAGESLAYLLDKMPVPEADIPRQLPGLTRVEEARPERQIPGGKEFAYWCQTACGGVALQTPFSEASIRRDRTIRSKRLESLASSSRPGSDALSWAIPVENASPERS